MSYENYRTTTITSRDSLLATHKVLRNTYFLLSLTLFFSALTSTVAVVTNAPYPGLLFSILGMFGLLFLTQYLRNSIWGIVSIFAFTGFMGYVIGPTLNMFLHTYSNGPQIIFTSLAATGAIFLTLSAYVLLTRKDFSFLAGILFIALIAGLILTLGAVFFQLPALQLGISGLFILIASGYILFDTSRIIHGGEQNYIMATISLYLNIYILFTNLLSLLGMTSSRD